MNQLRVGFSLVAALAGVAVLVPGVAGAQPLTVYDDALAAGWEDWSWAEHDLANPSPVASGTASILFEPDGWEGLFFHATTAHSAADYDRVRFQVHGGASGGQALTVSIQLGGTGIGQAALGPFLPGGSVPAGTWAEAVVPLSALGADPTTLFDGVIVQAGTAADQPAAFVDEVELLPNPNPPPPPGPVAISIDPALDRRPIDPRIYGVNFGDDALHADLRFPVRRRGGNATTRYNWQVDVHNTASDYFFQNIPAPDPGTLPHGSAADVFHDRTFEHGGEPVETVPLIGWTPRSDGRIKRWGFSVAGYGAQDQVECDLYDPPPPWCSSDSGNGRCESVPPSAFCQGGLIAGNDPGDTSEPIGPGFVTDWMAHVASRVGTAGQGGVSLWALDNEPMLWFETHRDVAPEPLDYDGLWGRTVQIAGAIKDADPQAEVLGPVVWGWCAYFTSAADWQVSPTCLDGPDRQAHGGLPLLAWYLEQVCAHQQATGVRLVDYLDVHYYPQGGVAGLGPGDSGEDAATSARRLRSLRELWDPAWVAESWIGEPVELIPRMRVWIDDHCPGTRLAITEYRWGADDGPSSALAHAEALAIFGREGVDLATRWVAPEPGTRVVDSFRMFLDYDGAGSRVDGLSVRAVSGDVEDVGAYAIEAPGGRLLVLLFNRDVAARQAQVTVAGGAGSAGTLYRFDPASPLAEIGPVAVTGDGFTLDLPARSANLVELSAALFADGFESGDTGAWSAAVP
jgi:hypothetical protein